MGEVGAMEEDDDVPQLGAHALAALQEFMLEQGAQPAEEGVAAADTTATT